MDDMQHLDGSIARYPHSSSRSNPLQSPTDTHIRHGTRLERRDDQSGMRGSTEGQGLDAPHAEHVDQVLLGEVVLLVDVALEGGEDVALVEEVLATVALEVEQRLVGDAARVGALGAVLGRDGEVLELLAEDDDRLLRQERVLRRRRAKVGRGRATLEELLLCGKQPAGVGGCSVELVSSMLEEVEDVVEAVWIELGRARQGERGVMVMSMMSGDGEWSARGSRTSTP